jgi:pyruvyltransferase
MAIILLAIKLFWWSPDDSSVNFGDHLSKVLIEQIVQSPIDCETFVHPPESLLFGIGSLLEHAKNQDIVWGSGFLFEHRDDWDVNQIDVRAVRGPLTRQILIEKGIACPEIYGDPALLFPRYFPQFKRQDAIYDYIIIPHIGEMYLFLPYKNVVFPSEPWDEVLDKILKSKLVISSSLHGIVLAEAYGIPARMLMMNLNTSLFKFKDYYAGTGRPDFQIAHSIHEALELQGEPPPQVDLDRLDQAFPQELFHVGVPLSVMK